LQASLALLPPTPGSLAGKIAASRSGWKIAAVTGQIAAIQVIAAHDIPSSGAIYFNVGIDRRHPGRRGA
jgi:hypothetical protein